MTQKEIDKLLANTKVYVVGKSKEIQEKLFSLGYCWHVGGSTEVKHENEPFLFIYKVHSISCTNDMCTFMRSEYREISAEEILTLELDKHNYRPFKNNDECLAEMMKHNLEEVKYASKDYVNYLLDKQEYHNEKYTEHDIKQAFEKGAEWADENPNSKTIAKYLYKEKGYPISLDGEIHTFEETMKDVQTYNAYKKEQWIEKACNWLIEQKEMIGISFQEDFIERFKLEMKKYTN